MKLTSPKTIKKFFLKHEIQPSKKLGQNFLIDENILKKIIKTANIKSNDIILEIGPGIGTLTIELAQKAKKVIAVEKDKTMIKILTETLKDYKNIEIIQGDILKIPGSKLRFKNYKIVANIPYYLTSPLIRKFLEKPPNNKYPKEIILMLQKEVAQRICAKPPHMNLLALCVQFYAEPKIISYVSKNCFWPKPKINSAIVKIVPKDKQQINHELFFKIVKAGFSHPRKQLLNNLSTSLKISKNKIEQWLFKNDIKPYQRAESLSINDWKNLIKTFVLFLISNMMWIILLARIFKMV